MYYLKKTIVPFVYLIFSSLIAFGVTGINGSLFFKYLLLSLNLILYLAIAFGIFNKTGVEGVKTLFINDLNRKEIIRTGKDIPIKRQEEYKTYKGFLFGVIICAPMIICMFIQSLIWIFGGQAYTFSGISSFLYFNFFGFFCMGSEFAVLPKGLFYLCLIFIPALSVFTGMGYLSGANKVFAERKRIQEKQEIIYGEKSENN